MPALPRKTQKIFGSSAGTNQIGVIGSFAAGSPAYSTDPDTIQSLANYLTGWLGVVVGQNSPAIQDMNALDFLITRQLAYIFERGIAEWDSATTYYIGSWVISSTGVPYISIADNNLNNALTDTTKWTSAYGATRSVTSANSPVSPLNRELIFVDTSGAVSIQLPAASLGYRFTIKDTTGSAGTNPITILRAGSESIEGVAASYSCRAPYGSWVFASDGTNWFII